jgi:hypothetical protein
MIKKVKKLLINPSKFWKEEEITSLKEVLFPFAFLLAAILPVSSVVGLFLFRNFLLHTVGLVRVIVFLILLSYCIALLVPILTGYVISYVAPYFGSERKSIKTIAMTVYSVTPFWIASVLNIYPPLFPLSLLGSLYSLYIFFMGCLYYLGMNPDRAIGFTLISAGIWIVITYIFALILGILTFGGLVIGVPLRI